MALDITLRVLGQQFAAAGTAAMQRNYSPFQQVQDHVEGDSAANRLRRAQQQRRNAQMSAVGGLIGQAPGGRMMQGIGKAFSAGGMIAGASMGITAILGIVKQLLGMSKIFGTFSKTFFQMMSMMVDIAIMPMIPHLMKFLNWWLREGTKRATEIGQWFARNGQDIADTIKFIGKVIGGIAKTIGFAIKTVQFINDPLRGTPLGINPEGERFFASGGVVTKPTRAIIGEAGPEAVIPLKGGGGGGMEALFATIGSGMSATAGIFAQYQKKATAAVDKIKVGARRNMEQWYFEMLGGSIVPDTIDSVGGVYEGMKNAAETNLQKTESQEPGMLSKIGGIFGAAWEGIKAGWNIASDWTSKAFGWLNPFGGEKKEPDPEGVTEDNGTPWYSGWSSTISTMWANSKEWISNAWGWLNPFGGDKDSPEGDIDASEKEGRPWYSGWTGTIGTMWANSKQWISDAWNWLNPFSSDDGTPENDVEASDTDGTSWYGGWATTIGNMWKNSKAWAKKAWGWLNPFKKEDEEPDPYSVSESSGSSWYLPWTWDIGGMWTKSKAWAKKAWSWLWPFGGKDGTEDPPEIEGVDEASGSPWYKDWTDTVKEIWNKLKGWLKDKTIELLNALPNPMGARDKVMRAAGMGHLIKSSGSVDLNEYGPQLPADWNSGNGDGGGGFFGALGGLKKKFGFQMGGVVPGGLGSPQLGLLHGGETVLPTHLGKNWAAATSGNMIASGGKSLDGVGGGGVFAPSVNRPMTVQIYTTENASDVITRLDRMASLEDAAFFSSV